MCREVPKEKTDDRIEVETAKKEKKSRGKEQEMVTIKKVCVCEKLS